MSFWLELMYLKLITLDISLNRVTVLPVELRFMVSLVELCVEHNPLTSPPAYVCYFCNYFLIALGLFLKFFWHSSNNLTKFNNSSIHSKFYLGVWGILYWYILHLYFNQFFWKNLGYFQDLFSSLEILCSFQKVLLSSFRFHSRFTSDFCGGGDSSKLLSIIPWKQILRGEKSIFEILKDSLKSFLVAYIKFLGDQKEAWKLKWF